MIRISKKTNINLLTLIAAFFFLISMGFMVDTYMKRNSVYYNIYLNNINLQGMNEKEVSKLIDSELKPLLKKNRIELKYNNFRELQTVEDLGGYYDSQKISKYIISLGKGSNIFSSCYNRILLWFKPMKVTFHPSINTDIQDKYISYLSSILDKDKKDCSISFSGDSMKYNDCSNGYKVDKNALKLKIKEAIEGSYSTIEIPIIEEKPLLTKELLNKMTILGKFSTVLSNTNTGRAQNVRTFMNKLNGTVIESGTIFSADKTSGERGIAQGYTYAKAFVYGQVVEQIGGGICIAVTTIYNAALLADLEIVERKGHSMPVPYIEMGRDATMSQGSVDLKIKNNKNYPIILQTYVTEGGYVVVNIWGIKENPQKKISITVKHLSDKKVQTYKNTYENGKLISSELISTDTYK